MRVVNAPDSDETPGWALFDWKDSPGTVLEGIDGLLAPFGLEIGSVDTGADDYLVQIVPREVPTGIIK